MSDIVLKTSKITKRSSKKQMQESLRKEIEKIDSKLNSLGIPATVKYMVNSTIVNHELPQNTVNIQNITDINFLYRLLAHYENLYNKILDLSEKITGKRNTDVTNTNGFFIRHIISDLSLRIRIVSNQSLINNLTSAKQKLAPFLDEDTRLFNAIKEVEVLYKGLLNE